MAQFRIWEAMEVDTVNRIRHAIRIACFAAPLDVRGGGRAVPRMVREGLKWTLTVHSKN
jgi:hypothetical protein